MVEVDISESEQEEFIDALDKAMGIAASRTRQAEMPSSDSSSSAGPLKQAHVAQEIRQAGGNILEEIHPGGHFMSEEELPKFLCPAHFNFLSNQISAKVYATEPTRTQGFGQMARSR